MNLRGCTQSRSLVLLALTLMVAACKEAKATAPSAPKPATSPSLSLGDKLWYEAGHRPAAPITVEKVYGAFEAAGIALTEKQQHVAAPFLAQYCFGSRGPAGVAFSVCEFESAEVAAAGKSESETTLASVPNRTLTVKGQTLLTVREPEPVTPQSAAVRKQAIELFEKL